MSSKPGYTQSSLFPVQSSRQELKGAFQGYDTKEKTKSNNNSLIYPSLPSMRMLQNEYPHQTKRPYIVGSYSDNPIDLDVGLDALQTRQILYRTLLANRDRERENWNASGTDFTRNKTKNREIRKDEESLENATESEHDYLRNLSSSIPSKPPDYKIYENYVGKSHFDLVRRISSPVPKHDRVFTPPSPPHRMRDVHGFQHLNQDSLCPGNISTSTTSPCMHDVLHPNGFGNAMCSQECFAQHATPILSNEHWYKGYCPSQIPSDRSGNLVHTCSCFSCCSADDQWIGTHSKEQCRSSCWPARIPRGSVIGSSQCKLSEDAKNKENETVEFFLNPVHKDSQQLYSDTGQLSKGTDTQSSQAVTPVIVECFSLANQSYSDIRPEELSSSYSRGDITAPFNSSKSLWNSMEEKQEVEQGNPEPSHFSSSRQLKDGAFNHNCRLCHDFAMGRMRLQEYASIPTSDHTEGCYYVVNKREILHQRSKTLDPSPRPPDGLTSRTLSVIPPPNDMTRPFAEDTVLQINHLDGTTKPPLYQGKQIHSNAIWNQDNITLSKTRDYSAAIKSRTTVDGPIGTSDHDKIASSNKDSVWNLTPRNNRSNSDPGVERNGDHSGGSVTLLHAEYKRSVKRKKCSPSSRIAGEREVPLSKEGSFHSMQQVKDRSNNSVTSSNIANSMVAADNVTKSQKQEKQDVVSLLPEASAQCGIYERDLGRKWEEVCAILQQPYEGHDKPKSYFCDYCGRVFSHLSSLNNHIRTHTGQKPFKCQYCGKRFAQSGVLTAHLRTHTGDRPFKCPACAKEFAQTTTLSNHIRTHTGQKPFSCRLCFKTFAQSSTRNKHELSHTKQRQFNCKYCGKSFPQSATAAVARHMRTHGKNDSYRCIHCGKTFALLHALDKHLDSHAR